MHYVIMSSGLNKTRNKLSRS